MQISEGTEVGDPPYAGSREPPPTTRQIRAESLHPPRLPPLVLQTPPYVT